MHPRAAIIGIACVIALGLAIRPARAVTTTPRDFVGTYRDAPGHGIEIVAGKTLFAVVDSATYALKVTGPNELTTVTGDKVVFERDSRGRITGYWEKGTLHPRVSAEVSAAAARLAYPRPEGVAYRYRPPADRHDGIAIGDIAKTPLGVETANAIVAGVDSGAFPNVHSVLLYLDGRLVLEEYFYGYDVDRPHQLRSATKSIVGALAGIAIDQGALSLETPAFSLLKLKPPANPDPRKDRMTIRNFLTMSSGLDCNDHSATSPGRETVLDNQPDWVKAMFDLKQVNDPGTAGFYCSGGVAVVGRAVKQATHTDLPDFADTHLFRPLGIRRQDWRWNYDLTNRDREYSQIHLRPRDMLKFGVLFAQGGVWAGKRLVSAAYVKAASSRQATVDGTEYGYFWWRPWLNVNGAHVYLDAAQGNGGQKIYVLPAYRLVAVFTGGDYNSPGSPMNQIMTTLILPKLIAANPGVATVP